MDEKLISENTQKVHFLVLQNAPFCSQIFKIVFASGGKGALTPPNQNPADVLDSCVASGRAV